MYSSSAKKSQICLTLPLRRSRKNFFVTSWVTGWSQKLTSGARSDQVYKQAPILDSSLTSTFNVFVIAWELISTVCWWLIPSTLAFRFITSSDTRGLASSVSSGSGYDAAARSSTFYFPIDRGLSNCQLLTNGWLFSGCCPWRGHPCPVCSTYSSGKPSALFAFLCSRRNLAPPCDG